MTFVATSFARCATDGDSMVPRLAARIFLVIVGLTLPLATLELVLRVAGPVVPGNYETGVWAEGHPVYGHFHVPGSTAWVREPEFTTFLRFNQHGHRGPDLAAPTDAVSSDQPRVLLLGDSFLEAKQVDEPQTLPQELLTAIASRDAVQPQVLNSGTFDWSQVHEYQYLHHAGPTLHPNLVVQFFYVGNDIGDAWPRSRGEVRESERPIATTDDDGELSFPDWRRRSIGEGDLFLGSLSRRSALVRAYETGIVDKLRYAERDGQGIEGQMLEIFRFKETPPEARAWRTVEALMLATRDEAERQGARYALVVVPSKWQVYKDDWRSLLSAIGETDDERWVLRGPNRRLTQLAESHGVPVLDLLPALREAARTGNERLYFPVDIHWTDAGHDVAANAVAEFLLADELLR